MSRRLCSSGIDQSKLRSPASRWHTGIPSLTAASAPASVELTSPGTTTRSGSQLAGRPASSPSSARAVCAPCAPEPTSSFTCGTGSGSSAKKTSLDGRVVVLARVDEPLLDRAALARARRRAARSSCSSAGRRRRGRRAGGSRDRLPDAVAAVAWRRSRPSPARSTRRAPRRAFASQRRRVGRGGPLERARERVRARRARRASPLPRRRGDPRTRAGRAATTGSPSESARISEPEVPPSLRETTAASQASKSSATPARRDEAEARDDARVFRRCLPQATPRSRSRRPPVTTRRRSTRRRGTPRAASEVLVDAQVAEGEEHEASARGPAPRAPRTVAPGPDRRRRRNRAGRRSRRAPHGRARSGHRRGRYVVREQDTDALAASTLAPSRSSRPARALVRIDLVDRPHDPVSESFRGGNPRGKEREVGPPHNRAGEAWRSFARQ